MVNLPSLRHLRHLTALDDHRHFGRAAKACHVTQSTLSAGIKELEGLLEATLVDRSKRRVVLTPVGVEAAERARRIIKEVEQLVDLFEDPFVVGLPRQHALAKEARVNPQRLWNEDLLLLKDGHCLRDHAHAAWKARD
jgi:DNA-binding transcriptional LysR family regulator